MQIIQRFIAAVIGIVALVLAFVFASAVLLVLVAVGLAAWGWLWWRARKMVAARGPGPSGTVIEGEFRDVTVERDLLKADAGKPRDPP